MDINHEKWWKMGILPRSMDIGASETRVYLPHFGIWSSNHQSTNKGTVVDHHPPKKQKGSTWITTKAGDVIRSDPSPNENCPQWCWFSECHLGLWHVGQIMVAKAQRFGIFGMVPQCIPTIICRATGRPGWSCFNLRRMMEEVSVTAACLGVPDSVGLRFNSLLQPSYTGNEPQWIWRTGKNSIPPKKGPNVKRSPNFQISPGCI